MEDQKIKKLLDKEVTVLSKFRTKNLVEINDDAHGTYSTIQIVKLNLRLKW